MSTSRVFSPDPHRDVLSLIGPAEARRYRAVPLRRDGRSLVVAVSNPRDLGALGELEFLTGSHVLPEPYPSSAIAAAIERHYPLSLLPVPASEPSGPIATAPVVALGRAILRRGLELGATDIHIDPGQRSARIRYRVDGHVVDGFRIPGWLHRRLVARIKVIARLDISEQRMPQDGHLSDSGEGVEARLSTLPTHTGEAVVLRLFGQREALPSLDGIRCDTETARRLRSISGRAQGVLLVAGPTGSGKTTTLYAVLRELRSRPLNIVTIEDPVEYRVEGIRQVQVDERSGLGFEAALRATLRQDPDVILVGEIRDAQTARIAFHAGLTGHLVLSTLHATGALSALLRLAELGVARGVLASTLVGAVSQRLLRWNCPACLDPDPDRGDRAERMGIAPGAADGIRRSRGCAACGFTGTPGRRPLFEVLEPSAAVRRQIVEGRDGDLREAALGSGFVPLLHQARDRVVRGEVGLGEAYRHCYFGQEE